MLGENGFLLKFATNEILMNLTETRNIKPFRHFCYKTKNLRHCKQNLKTKK